MKYKQTIDYLYNLEHFGVKLGLTNINVLLDRLGRPEKKFPIIHVAGTNGKGSVCAFLTHILMQAGYKTGRLTSPHVCDYRERISINGEMIPRRELIRWTEEVKPHVHNQNATFFEATTAIAFSYFADQKVDIGVVEVGLGGRLDATNVITPAVSVITDIDYDHSRILGDTLEKIAEEKAGIIKPGTPVISSSPLRNIQKLFQRICREQGAELYSLSDHCRIMHIQLSQSGSLFDAYLDDQPYLDLTSSLIGSYQPVNAMMAVAAIKHLDPSRFTVTTEDIRRGLETTKWPARFQLIFGNLHNLRIIIDAGHNPGGMRSFTETFQAVFPRRRATIIFGALARKNYMPMLNSLTPIAEQIAAVRLETHRGLDPDQLLTELPPDYPIPIKSYPSVDAAIHAILEHSQEDDILGIVGSLFLAGEALGALDKRGLLKK